MSIFFRVVAKILQNVPWVGRLVLVMLDSGWTSIGDARQRKLILILISEEEWYFFGDGAPNFENVPKTER